MKKRKAMTLAEHDAFLKSEGRYDAMMDRLDQAEKERQERVAEWRRAEAPLVQELRAAGYDVETAWDLIGTTEPYSEVLPILLDHLARPYPASVREGIARALAVPEAKEHWSSLTRLYAEEGDGRAKDGLAAALAAVSDDGVIGDVLRLVRDRQNGPSRVLLLSALEHSTSADVEAALVEATSDPELKQQAELTLRRLEAKQRRRKKASIRGRMTEAFQSLKNRLQGAPDWAGLHESSTSFDLDQVPAFLESVAGLVDGFGPEDAKELVSRILAMELDEEVGYEYRVTYGGKKTRLFVQLFLDDLEAPDISFFSDHRELIRAVDELMRAAFEAAGA